MDLKRDMLTNIALSGGSACAYMGIVAAILIFGEICPSVFAAAQEYKSDYAGVWGLSVWCGGWGQKRGLLFLHL